MAERSCNPNPFFVEVAEVVGGYKRQPAEYSMFILYYTLPLL